MRYKFSSAEKRRLWGDLIAVFQYAKRGYKKDGDKFLAGPFAIGQN